MFNTVNSFNKPIETASPHSNPSPSIEKAIFNTTVNTEIAPDKAASFKQTAAEITSSDSPSMLETLGKTDAATFKEKAHHVAKGIMKSIFTSSFQEKEAIQEKSITDPDALLAEKLPQEELATPEKLDSFFGSESAPTEKTLIDLFKEGSLTTPSEPIIDHLSNAINDIKDFSLKGDFLQTQYDNGVIDLEQLRKILYKVIRTSLEYRADNYFLRIENNTLQLKITEVGVGPHVNNYEVHKLLSKIKSIKYVFFNPCPIGDQIEEISFPYVEKVDIGVEFAVNSLYPLNFAKLFPHASHYSFRTQLEGLATLLQKIPEGIARLSCIDLYNTPLQPEIFSLIKMRFKDLKIFDWKNNSTGEKGFYSTSNSARL